MSDISTILGEWRSSGIRYVRFELPDMHGISRSKTIPIDHAGEYAEHGLNMYGGSVASSTRAPMSWGGRSTTRSVGTATSSCSPTRLPRR